MARTLQLDGDTWEMREALGESWRWYAGARPASTLNSVTSAATAATASRSPWIPARAPGAVIGDLVRAGEVPEPRHARDSRAAEWVAERHWVYRRPVELPPTDEGERVVLELDGVDPGAIVFWDGAEVGAVDGMFHAARIEIPDGEARSPGEHLLGLVIPPAPQSEPQVGRTERVTRLAPRLGYGWDFSPRLRHQGVWRSLRLRIGAVQLSRVHARAELDDSGRGRVRVAFTLEAPAEADVPVRLEVRRDGTAASVEDVLRAGEHTLEAEVDRPELWWPAALGEPARYDVALTAGGLDGQRWGTSVGFRRIDWVPNPGAPDGALPYSAVVNGRPLALVGWNWAPVDTLYGEIEPARIRHLVDLAARSGARLLRVWGGGLAETAEFYEACDEAGLLVWQEFAQSSSGMQSAPSEDPAFVAHAVREAEEIVPRLASHPSLALWCGGNELEDDAGPLDESRSPVLAALRDAVARLHPGAGWLPTSPSGPVFHHRIDRLREDPGSQHDVHGPWEHQGLVAHYELGNAGAALAHTEFGVEGMTNRRALDAVVDADEQWPADRRNPVYRHLGEWWNNAELVQESFGGRLADVDAMQRASQLLQATGLQYSVEADRRRAPRCSIVLPWQLAESFPNAWCTSAVDYFGEPKPAYFAVARAFAPRRVTLRVDRAVWAGESELRAQAWLWSEHGDPAGGRVTLRLRDAHGRVLGERSAQVGVVGPPSPVVDLGVPAADVPRDAVVTWDAEWQDASGAVIDRELALASSASHLGPLLDLAPARLDIDARTDGDTWRVQVRHLDGPLVVGLALLDARPVAASGHPVYDGDPRPLLPGEERTFRIRWTGDDPAQRALTLSAWNTDRTTIRGTS